MISFLYNVVYCVNIQKSIQNFNESYTLICQASQKTLSNNWLTNASNRTFAKNVEPIYNIMVYVHAPKSWVFLQNKLIVYSKFCLFTCFCWLSYRLTLKTGAIGNQMLIYSWGLKVYKFPYTLWLLFPCQKLDYMICKSILTPWAKILYLNFWTLAQIKPHYFISFSPIVLFLEKERK